MTTETIESPLAHLSEEQIEELGREFDAIHDEVFDDLGERDAKYIRSMIELHRRLALMGRAALVPSRLWPAWVFGTASLSAAKILENMEIGHNVMHGQWDWMNNPEIHSSTWDWDTASTKEAWKHSHNYVHHTYTNIRGKDKDLGYEIMRIDPHQPWHPVYLLQPFYNVLLMALFEWGVAVHDLDFDAIRSGEKPMTQVREELKGIAGKARAQIVKDYIAFPALSGLIMGGIDAASRDPLACPRPGASSSAPTGRPYGRTWPRTWSATSGPTRSSSAVTSPIRPTPSARRRSRTRARAPGTCASSSAPPTSTAARSSTSPRATSATRSSITSTRTCPRPATREIAPKVRDVCKRYGLPYNTGPFSKQWGSVQRTILRLAFPGGKPRPKPGPYRGTDTEAATNGDAAARATGARAASPRRPRTCPRTGPPGSSGGAERGGGCARALSRRQHFLEVAMRGAVARSPRRLAPTGGAGAAEGVAAAALERAQPLEHRHHRAHLEVDDHPHPQLHVEREQAADLAEQEARRVGEVVRVGGEALGGRLAGVEQHAALARDSTLARIVAKQWRQPAIQDATQRVVHVDPSIGVPLPWAERDRCTPSAIAPNETSV